MHESTVDLKRRWVVAAVGALAIVVTLVFLFRFPAPSTSFSGPAIATVPKARVQMSSPDEGDVLLKAEAELRDLRPLFLPTERNAALPEPRLEPGRTFLQAETLKPTFSEAEAQISKDLPPVATLGDKPVDKAALADALSPQENELTLQGFGRAMVTVPEFEPRGGYVEVTAMSDGRRVFGEALPLEAKPAVDKSWAPVEFIAAVDPAGLVSPLVVTEGSRVEEVDAHYRTYLAQTFRIGERLSPGFYRITVAP